MSENIKPSEVSSVLLEQLQGIDTSLHFEEVGTVLQVSDGVVRISGALSGQEQIVSASSKPLSAGTEVRIDE